jgi:hypothetical protein
MATTALFAEILIIGLLTLFWVALAVVSILGVPDLGGFKGWEVLAAAGVLSLAYVLGIPADRLADTWSDGADKKLWKKWGLPPANNMSRDELRLRLTASPSLAWLDYARSRRRIARASVLDGSLAGIVAGALLLLSIWIRIHVPRELLWAVLAVSALVVGASAYAWYRIGKTYFKLLSLAYSIQERKEAPLTKPED